MIHSIQASDKTDTVAPAVWMFKFKETLLNNDRLCKSFVRVPDSNIKTK